jgi:hypothetical protein
VGQTFDDQEGLERIQDDMVVAELALEGLVVKADPDLTHY